MVKENIEPKVPSKRGRKPKTRTPEEEKKLLEPKIPKKRGRKPKPKDPNAIIEEYIPKKRGRKRKDQSLIDPDKSKLVIDSETINNDINRSVTNDLILYLPNISSDDLKLINFSSTVDTNINNNVESNDINDIFNKATTKHYNTKMNIPKAYNQSSQFYQFNQILSKSTSSKQNSNTNIPSNYNLNNTESWIKNTNTKCYHCTYNFDTMPCAIPYRYSKKIYYVYGCFCSFECAYKYLLNNKIHKKQEVISLLHSLKKHFYNHEKTEPIVPAPNKEVLIDYGGNITIDEFRENNISKENQYNICIPPLVPINHIVETIKNNTTNSGIKHKTKSTSLYDMMVL
jgi:hypothetical protein